MHDTAGTVNRCKARLFMQVSTQTQGLHHDEAREPCPARAIFRCLLAVAAECDCEVGELDIKNAYLNAAMHKDVHIEQPDRQERGGLNIICMVDQALCGAEQPGTSWHDDLDEPHKDAGIDSSKADLCCYIRRHPMHAIIHQLVHVDDVFTVARSKEVLEGGRLVMKGK